MLPLTGQHNNCEPSTRPAPMAPPQPAAAAGAVLFREQIHRAWTNTPGITDQQRIDVILENIGPNVRGEIKCLPRVDREDLHKLLAAIVSIFGERRTPAQPRDSTITGTVVLSSIRRLFSEL